RRGETEYALGALPAGGYVKITGMHPDEIARLAPEVRARAYYAQPPWKRIIVILAGPGVNIVIAFVLFWAVLLGGNRDGAIALERLDRSLQTVQTTSSVLIVERGTPAARALVPGDRILAVDGRPTTVAAARAAIASHRCLGTPREGCRAATPI